MSDPKREGSGTKEQGPGADGPDDLVSAREEFLQVFKRGAEFTEELLQENERLRYRIAQLESQGEANDDALLKELMDKIRRLEGERDEHRRRFAEVEAENRDFANRYVEIEAENNNLINVYVASYQLHSTLDFDEVLHIITEIILNFIGASVFGIALLDDKSDQLRPLVAEGVEREELGKLRSGDPIIGQVIHTGESYVGGGSESAQPPQKPVVCIPLTIREDVIGVILIYEFLQQKVELAKVDHDLFSLLAGHAATAIFSSRLYTDSQRKLSTIQGLIDLVTSEDAAG